MKNNLIFCFLLSLLNVFLIKTLNYLLDLNGLIYQNLSEKLTSDQITHFIAFQKKWEWINYFVTPLFLFFKTIIITSIVYTGVFFFSKKQVFFKQILNVVFRAELIFLLVPIVKIAWFYFFETSYKLEDIQHFYPLSAINITGYNGLEQWLIYPFQALNLFEVAYIIYLGYELGKLTETNHDNGLKIMSYSYVPMMMLWIAVVMFFTLNYS